MIKNSFGLAIFATTASLGLGLMISGCGDSGSTTPNPLEGDTSAKVVFNYSVLAQKLSAKTDIPANIASVKYSFKGVDENQKALPILATSILINLLTKIKLTIRK